jgi:dihydrodiol dehydrogenase / D-xylose 1-dehydrogenase (NADP)
MNKKIKWGILGTGAIANLFAEGLKALKNAELIAVGSRSKDSAESFGNKFNIERRYASYVALAGDPDIDAVYISTPHPFHKSNTLLCLKNKKAVLCEKPFAMNSNEATEMINYAEKNGLFLMEGMWMYFFPAIEKVKELIKENAIGKIHLLDSKFCFKVNYDPKHRLFNPDLGGGTLLDIGVYNIALAYMIFNRPPDSIVSTAHIGNTKVDEQASLIFNYNDEALAELTSSFRFDLPCDAEICGSEGWIRILPDFWAPDVIQLKQNNKNIREYKFKRLGNGYSYEAEEVMRCLFEGKTESNVMPHNRTLEIMNTMDTIREQWNLKYPME